MSSPARRLKKPKLSRESLKKHNIVFLTKAFEWSRLPEWLQPIHQELTRLRSQIADDAKKVFAEELEYEDPRAGRDHNCWSLLPAEDEADAMKIQTRRLRPDKLRKKMEKELRFCEKIREKVIELDETNVKESYWQGLSRDHFFKTCYSSNGGSDSFK
jgi:hypothetical protein